MRRATHIHRAGDWPDESAVAAVTLAFDDRHRRRIRMSDDAGEPFLLDLPEAVLMVDGDGLALVDGGYIQVRAADEAVADIRGESPAHTARLAWHIGNRHTPVQVLPDSVLRIRDDHVLVAMAEGLGATVVCRTAPFSPEPGAYAGGGHAHDH
ncbi:MAG: urease accessory protein UreE [Alphaproteobacteria bacterium]|jgi:urease accessory protein|nr:urease accessory protein UreE [Alphaproteobacteria bacterium]